MILKQAISLVVLAALAGVAPSQNAVAIKNATVETLSKAGRLKDATVVLRGGKVEAVGKDVAVPEDAEVIDAVGGTVMPGIVEPNFEVAIGPGQANTGTQTVVIRGRVVVIPTGGGTAAQTYTRIADNFYPFDAGFKPLPRVGLTRFNIVTRGQGQAAVARATPADPGHMLDKADGVAFAGVSNQSDTLGALRNRLDAANRAKTGSESARSSASTRLWIDVLDGKSTLLCEVANAAAIVHLMKVLEAYPNVKPALFSSGAAAVEAIDAIKDKPVKVVLRPGLELAPNTRDRIAPARILNDAGVEVMFSLYGRPASAEIGAEPPEDPAAQDFPLFPVAVMVKCGMPRLAALEALTKRPARMLGLEGVGTIEPGKSADLLLFSGDPLDTAGRLRYTFVEGKASYANQ